MALPPNDPRPPYQLAADKLREEITSGRLKPGDRLPSSRDLRESLGIANATVHSALRVLRDEGLIYSVQGRGSYVSDPESRRPSSDRAEGAPPATETVSVEEFRRLVQDVADLHQRINELMARVADLSEDRPHQPKQ
ncbi:GntR family transcriptional regulator [Streptomyces sedi]|uniref:Winged helix-turn-helix transcriptional regulator n=1 Tax=Streptomyces sedi TaxID=555059 RepID=A0A5C4V8P6_9ACTN|nr:winged helix-turn-helix domain-containing protein [Streptomyces sedi]TNM32278.1 winged helix-turn-helix transcriptional regulator [Streptomyces sedi]